MEENKQISMDDLAGMINRGFMNMDKKFDKRFDEVDKKFNEVDIRLEKIEAKLSVLELGQEDIKLRQDSSAQHFEVVAQEKTLEEHGQRIGVLERKILITG